MNIVAPIVTAEEAKKSIEAGANELYCGIMPAEWQEKYTNVVSPNRREVRNANFTSWKELEKAVRWSNNKGVKVILTLNDLYYKTQYPLILEQAGKAASIGIGGFMIADLGFLDLLKEENLGIPIHISTGGTTFNSQTVEFYKSLGAERIILPRHLSLREIKNLVTSNPEVNFELFILNAGCRNVDGFCTFIHGLGEFEYPEEQEMFFRTAACYLDYDIEFEKSEKKDAEVPKRIREGVGLATGFKSCGACFLNKFKEWGVWGIKIVGRDYSTDIKIKDVKFIHHILEYIKNRPDEMNTSKFKNYVQKLFWETYKVKCRKRCYYRW